MKKSSIILLSLLLLAAIFSASIFTIRPTEQAIKTRFSKIVGDPIEEAGLHFKIPFIDTIHRLNKRVLEWSGATNKAAPTRDKLYILVESFARWRIVDPKLFFVSLTNETRAQSRIDGILDSETRSAIAAHDLVEIVRSDKDRKFQIDPSLADVGNDLPDLPAIQYGRAKIETEILRDSKDTLRKEFGIELLDVRFKRVNYSDSVLPDIYKRMISERTKIAEKFRSEGQGLASEVLGNKERELKTILSKAYRTSEEIRGKADAAAAAVYSKAFNSSPAAADFYQFLKTLESYESSIDKNSTLVMSSDSEFLKYLNGTGPAFPMDKIQTPPQTPETQSQPDPAPRVGLEPPIPASAPEPAPAPPPTPATPVNN